ncbi:hypothetical protein ABZX12_34015 [Kribbella sp. NPDC003505]|uniref:hypothetical protein n=1 Tax=Kribbella sp. NPDC003505 TaxID=3154448 RepID=UPI0033A64D4E
MTPEEALTEGFQKWLDATVPAETGAKVTWEKIDPYVTSTRSAEFLADGVARIKAGTLRASPGRPQQRLTDLAGAALATGGLAAPALTPLGAAVAAAWARHDILQLSSNDAKRYEFSRNVVLVETALRRRELPYVEWFRHWRRLRTDRPAGDWFGDVWGLTLAAYLRVRRGGYHPYDVMVAAGCPPWKHRSDLEHWSATMRRPAGWSRSRLSVLLADRVGDTASRAGAKVMFCRAMEAVCLKREGASSEQLHNTFTAWGVEDA